MSTSITGHSMVPRLKVPPPCTSCIAKLDRLDWQGGIAFVSHDVRIGIRVNDMAALEKIATHLPPAWKPSPSPVVDQLFSLILSENEPNSSVRRFHMLYGGIDGLARTTDIDEVYDVLESMLHYHVAVNAPHHVFAHAGVVGWQGKAIVIPGRSLSGKTSLVKALVRAGATYYSDEYAVFDAQGYVHPYAKPLSLRADGELHQTNHSVESLGGCAGTEALPVGLVLLTDYQPGAKWRPRALSPGQSLIALMEHTIPVRERPQAALETLQHIVPDALTLRGKRGEANEVTPLLLKRLELSSLKRSIA